MYMLEIQTVMEMQIQFLHHNLTTQSLGTKMMELQIQHLQRLQLQQIYLELRPYFQQILILMVIQIFLLLQATQGLEVLLLGTKMMELQIQVLILQIFLQGQIMIIIFLLETQRVMAIQISLRHLIKQEKLIGTKIMELQIQHGLQLIQQQMLMAQLLFS